jgi:hypothetical protein
MWGMQSGGVVLGGGIVVAACGWGNFLGASGVELIVGVANHFYPTIQATLVVVYVRSCRAQPLVIASHKGIWY